MHLQFDVTPSCGLLVLLMLIPRLHEPTCNLKGLKYSDMLRCRSHALRCFRCDMSHLTGFIGIHGIV